MKDVILVGAGKGFIQYMLNCTEKENVRYIFDNYLDKKEYFGIPVIQDYELLKSLSRESEVIIIAVSENAKFELAYQLERRGIPFRLYYNDIQERVIHIKGKYPNITSSFFNVQILGSDNERMLHYQIMKATLEFFLYTLKKYEDCFLEKQIDIWIFTQDKPSEAYRMAVKHGIRHIFAWYTAYSVQDRVISFPDYRSCFDNQKYVFEETQENCEKASQKPYIDSRAFFSGSLASAPEDARRMLGYMADKYPKHLVVNEFRYLSGSNNPKSHKLVPMLEQVKYKYLIDIRGGGSADRTKILLQLGRPIFIVDRPFKEWFFDDLKPMEHYIPVKQDLSDLIEKIDYMEEHPDLYEHIVKQMKEFSKKRFSKDSYLEYLKDIVLKFGIVP